MGGGCKGDKNTVIFIGSLIIFLKIKVPPNVPRFDITQVKYKSWTGSQDLNVRLPLIWCRLQDGIIGVRETCQLYTENHKFWSGLVWEMVCDMSILLCHQRGFEPLTPVRRSNHCAIDWRTLCMKTWWRRCLEKIRDVYKNWVTSMWRDPPSAHAWNSIHSNVL